MNRKNFNLKGFLVENKLTEASRGNRKRTHFGEIELSDKVRLLSEVKKPLDELHWATRMSGFEKADRLGSVNSEVPVGKKHIKRQQADNLYPNIVDILNTYGLDAANIIDTEKASKVDLINYVMYGKTDDFPFENFSRRELRQLDQAAEEFHGYNQGLLKYRDGKWQLPHKDKSLSEGDDDPMGEDYNQNINEAGYVDDDDFEDDLGTAHGTDDIEYDPRAARVASRDITSDSFDDDEEESFDDPEDLDDDDLDDISAEEPAVEDSVSLSDLKYNPATVEWDPDFDLQEYVFQWPENKWPTIIRVLQQGLNQAQKEANENGSVWKRGLYMYRCSRTDSNKQLGYNTRDYKTSVINPASSGDFIQMIAKIKPDPQAMKDLGWD